VEGRKNLRGTKSWGSRCLITGPLAGKDSEGKIEAQQLNLSGLALLGKESLASDNQKKVCEPSKRLFARCRREKNRRRQDQLRRDCFENIKSDDREGGRKMAKKKGTLLTKERIVRKYKERPKKLSRGAGRFLWKSKLER